MIGKSIAKFNGVLTLWICIGLYVALSAQPTTGRNGQGPSTAERIDVGLHRADDVRMVTVPPSPISETPLTTQDPGTKETLTNATIRQGKAYR